MNKKNYKKNSKQQKKKNDDSSFKKMFIILNLIIFFLVIEQILMFTLLFKSKEEVVLLESLPKIDVKELNNIHTANEKFEFDGLNITFSNDISFERVNNKYSNYNNRLVVKVPITIENTNNFDYSFNIYNYMIYGPSSKELDEVAGYFDESLFYADDLKPNESYTKYLYFLYDSNGNYTIEFNKEQEHTKVVLNIKRKSDLKTQENYYYENNNNFI